jgi:predicted O-linked N-acetylglucosamine transferase (SPINDLY family)
VAALPCRSNGFVTYGCFNSLYKINEEVIGLWSRILQADATGRLFLKAKQLASRELREALVAGFARHGIPESRLIVESSSTYSDYLAAYARVDIALDPFPFPGGATTAESLWMGVPVVNLKGDRFIAHQGESLLQAAGLPEWIASGGNEYVALALAAAAAPDRLAATRAGLRAQVAPSPLFDAPRYARSLEKAWRGMWREWCSKQA